MDHWSGEQADSVSPLLPCHTNTCLNMHRAGVRLSLNAALQGLSKRITVYRAHCENPRLARFEIFIRLSNVILHGDALIITTPSCVDGKQALGVCVKILRTPAAALRNSVPFGEAPWEPSTEAEYESTLEMCLGPGQHGAGGRTSCYMLRLSRFLAGLFACWGLDFWDLQEVSRKMVHGYVPASRKSTSQAGWSFALWPFAVAMVL